MSEARPVNREEAGVLRFIERFAGQLAEAGFQRMAARVFVALLAADSGRLTAADLAQLLQISPAAVSGAVRYLGQINMVERERDPGSRRDFYVVNDDLWYDAITRRDQIMGRWESVLREGVEALGADSPAGQRMQETLAFFEFMHQEMPQMMARWQEHRAELHRKWGLTD